MVFLFCGCLNVWLYAYIKLVYYFIGYFLNISCGMWFIVNYSIYWSTIFSGDFYELHMI